MKVWVDGFPGSAQLRQCYAEEIRTWLREPDDLKKLVAAVCGGIRHRYASDQQPAGNRSTWADLGASVSPPAHIRSTKRPVDDVVSDSWGDFATALQPPKKKANTLAPPKPKTRNPKPETQNPSCDRLITYSFKSPNPNPNTTTIPNPRPI